MNGKQSSVRRHLAIIMAGGSGERFWPLSRCMKPKQLLRLTHPEKTLLEEAVDRIAPLVDGDGIYLSTTALLAESIKQTSLVPEQNVLVEPVRRNTLGCIAWAAAHAITDQPDSWRDVTISVLLSDHKISPAEAFRADVRNAVSVAESTGGLVTIGIEPSRPECGFGYIEVCEPVLGGLAFRSGGFKEKPSRDLAEVYVSEGRHLWNSGMLFFTLDGLMSELEKVNPACSQNILQIADRLGKKDLAGAEKAFSGLPNISIDYALLEKSSNVYVVKGRFEWDDVGSLDALDRSLPTDADGNVVEGNVLAIGSAKSIIYNDNESVLVCTLGVHGLVVIVTTDAVLVCPKHEVQRIREITAKLQERSPEHL